MAILPIRLYPDPVLRKRCRPVESFDESLRRLVEDMVQTMVAAPGVGLAAPQVGKGLRLAVVDVSVGRDPDCLHVLANPRIVERQGEVVDLEACLSMPGISERVARPRRVIVEAQDLNGETYEIEGEDFLARALCHELDHLDGVLFVDHIRGLRRERVRRQLKKLKKSQEDRIPASVA